MDGEFESGESFSDLPVKIGPGSLVLVDTREDGEVILSVVNDPKVVQEFRKLLKKIKPPKHN